MRKKELIKHIAKLESINDQLAAELKYLDNLLREVGFEEGLKTLKQTAYDLLNDENFNEPPEAI